MALIPLNTFKTKTAVLTTAEYNSKTCARDTGLIIDSIAFDLLYGYDRSTSNSTQSMFAGLQYWAQDAIKIPGDVLQTLAALDRAKEISKQIILNEPVTFSSSYPTDELNNPIPAQITDQNNVGDTANQQKVQNEYDLISSIIENGTKGITNLIVPNEHDIKAIAIQWQAETEYDYGTILKFQDGTIENYYRVVIAGISGVNGPTHITGIEQSGDVSLEYIAVDEKAYNSANLLLANKELIQEEVTAYVVDNFNKFIYDKDQLIKNTRLIIDSLAFDLLFKGSSQSKFIGLQYWEIGDTTKIPLQVKETIAAIGRAKEITLQIIKNETVIKSPNNSFDQAVDLINPGNSASFVAIEQLFDLIINILTNGVTSATDIIVPNSQMTTYTGLLNAYNLIQANKLFIQAEIIAWIDDQIANEIDPFTSEYPFDNITRREKCYRDVGYIIDCVSFDLVYTSTTQANRQSVQAGVYYYNRTADLTITSTEQSQVITIFNYLKSLIDDIITGKAISVTRQSDIKQLTNSLAATTTQIEYVKSHFDLITNIIENGPSLVNEVEPISLVQSNDPNDMNGFRLLLANKDFLVAEAVGFISNLTESSFNLSGDRLALCKRDIGYILDCIMFDLRHGGNRQAIQSGVYYYDHSAKINVIPRERIDTTEAYNHMKTVIEGVLKNTAPNVTYQSAVKQFTNLDPISINDNEVIRNNIIETAKDLVAKINLIISSGPVALTDIDVDNNKRPINLNVVELINDGNELIKAFNLLLANREYIIAEVIGYLNTKLLTRPNTTKIYTAPPGVTAIILMAQAANVTNRDVEVTFAHYRNIPVFSDPATYNGYQAANTITELVKDFVIPSKNAATLIDGKMIVESFDSVIAYANVNEGIKVTLSILETANA